MPDVWPSVRAYLSLFKAFQGFSVSPRVSGAQTLSGSHLFRFAAASSDNSSLPKAVAACVREVPSAGIPAKAAPQAEPLLRKNISENLSL